MRVSQFLLVFAFSSVSISSFAEKAQESTQAPGRAQAALSVAVATATLASLGLAGYKAALVMRRAPKISAAGFLAMVAWEVVAEKVTRNEAYRITSIASKLRERAVVPLAEKAGYGFGVYYTGLHYVVRHTVTVGKEWLDTLVFTPLESARNGISKYCEEHGFDPTSGQRYGLAAIAAAVAIPAVIARFR